MKVCEELAASLAAAAREERQRIIAEHMARWNVSRGTAYRHAKRGGFQSGREGIGGREATPLPVEKLELIAAMIHQTASKKYPPKMSTKHAIRVGIQSGYWQPGELTEDMVNRYMREHCPRVPKCGMESPPIPRVPDYVNQVGEFDVSNCAQFYLMDDGRVGPQDEAIYGNKNKSSKGGPQSVIRRAVYTEVLTNSFYVEYFLGAESTETLVPILHRAWLPKKDPSKYPLFGMPEILIADKGSGLKNIYCENLFDNLGISFRPHKQGKPRAKGPVETLMWHVECRIESLLQFEPATCIDHLNQLVYNELINVNGLDEHSRYDLPRSVAFASWVRSEHLRLPPIEWEYFHRLGYREKEIKISKSLSFNFQGRGYTFMADTENYSDPAIMGLAGELVTVMYSPFDNRRVRVRTRDGREYFPALIEKDKYGYPQHAIRMKAPQSAPPLARPVVIENIERAREMNIAEVGGGPVRGFAREDDLKNLRFMVKPGIAFGEGEEGKRGNGENDVLRIPRLEAKKKLQDLLERKLNREESEYINERWGQMVAEAAIGEMMKTLKPETDHPQISQINAEGIAETA